MLLCLSLFFPFLNWQQRSYESVVKQVTRNTRATTSVRPPLAVMFLIAPLQVWGRYLRAMGGKSRITTARPICADEDHNDTMITMPFYAILRLSMASGEGH